MPLDDYTSTPSTGKLKLKGIKDSNVTKKKHRPSSSAKEGKKPEEDGFEDKSIMLKKLKDEDRDIEREDEEDKKRKPMTPKRAGK